ncbi:MAG: ROK family protein [Ginsengibacter sp.]
MENKSSWYKRKIIKELCFGNTLSAQEISVLTGKSLPLTIRMLNELVKEKIVAESGYALSTGGRRPLMYSLVPGNMYVISVAMDQYITRIAFIDLQDFKITQEKKYDLDLYRHTNELAQLTGFLQDFISGLKVPKERLIGIGIGMPGFVDVKKGINYSFMESGGESIVNHLEKEIGLPVYLDNDSSLIALAELKLGAAQNKTNAAVINFGWGVGLGMIVDKTIFRGNNGFAGEFSHIPLFDNNKLCECGKSGCLETEASMIVVVEKVKEAIKSGRVSRIKEVPENIEEAFDTIISAAKIGDQLTVDILSEVAFNIGRGIAILIHILNPELVVVSGRGAAAGNILIAPIQQAVHRFCIPRLASFTDIKVSTLSKKAELIGAAALVVENYDKRGTKDPVRKEAA